MNDGKEAEVLGEPWPHAMVGRIPFTTWDHERKLVLQPTPSSRCSEASYTSKLAISYVVKREQPLQSVQQSLQRSGMCLAVIPKVLPLTAVKSDP